MSLSLQEFAAWILSQDNTFEMAYAIDQDKVANMTIRLQFNSDSKWTKALKYMLTNLKYCMKWAITHQKLDRNASAARHCKLHASLQVSNASRSDRDDLSLPNSACPNVSVMGNQIWFSIYLTGPSTISAHLSATHHCIHSHSEAE